MKRYLLELSYKGTNYQGWQIQPNGDTVQSVLNQALSVILRKNIETTGCGRTDTGVHALQFFAHFDGPDELPPRMLSSLNGILPHDIAVFGVRQVESDFNARFQAVSRTYEYRIIFEKNPFLHHLAVLRFQPLDLTAMNEACELLVGEKDFSCFSKVHTDVRNYICNVVSARWFYREDVLIFEITANRFLRNMVRAVVGTMLEVGEGKINLEKFSDILVSKDRKQAGTSVPAHGLFLVSVAY